MSVSINRRTLLAGAAAVGMTTCVRSVSARQEPQKAAATVTAGTARSSSKTVVEWPIWDNKEEEGLLDVLNSGTWGRTSGGRKVPAFEAAFAEKMKAKYCLATSSGTSALLTTLGALGIGPGDEVIIPPYTFVATFNAITHSFALPVFADSDPETFQIDPKKMEAAITPNTKLLMPVHIGGSVADMDAIDAIAKARNIPIIEDACQAPLAEYRGIPVGTRGLGGCFSFQASKNINAGEGGAVITNDEQFANQCFNFHTPGNPKPTRPSLGRGSNYRITEFQAALLLAQLSRLEEHSQIREKNAAYLSELLKGIPGISPAKLSTGSTRSAWHLYMFRYDASQFANLSRAAFIKELGKQGIAASTGYDKLNQTSHVKAIANNPHYHRVYGKDYMARWAEKNVCPANDQLCEQAIWFGQRKLLTQQSDMDQIAKAIADIQKRAPKLAQAS
jgi:dTDP-4-amino-4,6-dideoxygalactose transaminase